MADSRYKNNNAGDIVNGPDGAVRKQKVAVALQYNKGEQAPKIIASGKGHIADKIIEKQKIQMFQPMKTASLPILFLILK